MKHKNEINIDLTKGCVFEQIEKARKQINKKPNLFKRIWNKLF